MGEERLAGCSSDTLLDSKSVEWGSLSYSFLALAFLTLWLSAIMFEITQDGVMMEGDPTNGQKERLAAGSSC